MRNLVVSLCASLLAVGCAHPAYGPSSDARLEAATSSSTSSEGADVAGLKCSDLKGKFAVSRDSEVPEGERLTKMTEVFVAAKERSTKLDDAVARNPDLLYSADAQTIKANMDECRSFYADVRSDFDRFLRDLCDLPVIKDVASSRDVARVELGVLRTAITALDSDDKDVLMNKVDAAERKTGGAKPDGNGKAGRKK